MHNIIAFLTTTVLLLIALFFYYSNKENNIFSKFKKLTGDSRWARKHELRSYCKKITIDKQKYNNAGVVLDSNGYNAWVDDNEGHSLIIGTSGSGKTRRVINPSIKILAGKGENIVVTDPKMELYKSNYSALKENNYNIILLNFRDPLNGNAWNPLEIPYKFYSEGNIDKAVEFLEALSVNIFYTDFYSNTFNSNSYLEKAAADYFCALALILFTEGENNEINLNSIANLSTAGEAQYQENNYIHKYFENNGNNHPGYFFAQGILQASGENKNQILTTFAQRLRVFVSRYSLSEMLSYSDFDISTISKEKTAIFITVHDEKSTYHALAAIFIKQCYEYLIFKSQLNSDILPIRLNFILEEFGNMPPIQDFANMITASRSRNIRFNLVIQGITQLDMIYKYETSDVIQGNCSNIICLLVSEQATLENISKLCGQKKTTNKQGQIESQPLISISDLQRLKTGDAIIIKHHMYPFRTTLPDQSKYPFENKDESYELPIRTVNSLSVFDFKNKFN